MEIGLVSCTKSKREQAAEPADLYMPSTFFTKAREYAETNHERWYILSAKHHLLDPSGPSIDPYDETLTGAPVARKREWAETVYDQLEAEGVLDDEIYWCFTQGATTTTNSSHCWTIRRSTSKRRLMVSSSVEHSRGTTNTSENPDDFVPQLRTG